MLVHLSFNFLEKPLNSGAIRIFYKSLKNKATLLTITTYLYQLGSKAPCICIQKKIIMSY